MRHLRMVGVCLMAVFAVGAIAAGPAFATKDPWKVTGTEDLGPVQILPATKTRRYSNGCYAGITDGGSNGGYFEYGKVKVNLNKPITMQGGFKGNGTRSRSLSRVQWRRNPGSARAEGHWRDRPLQQAGPGRCGMAGGPDGKLEGSQEKQGKRRLRQNRNGR